MLCFLKMSIAYVSFSACPFQFRFAILVAGFKSNSLQHSSVYSECITIPTLHVFGDTDQVIPKGKKTFLTLPIEENSCGRRNKRTSLFPFLRLDMSEDLLQYFSEPIILNHTGGHFIPASSAHRKTYTDFLQNMKK